MTQKQKIKKLKRQVKNKEITIEEASEMLKKWVEEEKEVRYVDSHKVIYREDYQW